MKLTFKFYVLLSSFLLAINSYSQSIKGRVIDESSGKPLEYANVIVVDMPVGTNTNNKGEFKLGYNEKLLRKNLRFSMIGYESIEKPVSELLQNDTLIRLKENTTVISKIEVTPFSGKIRKVGNSNSNNNIIIPIDPHIKDTSNKYIETSNIGNEIGLMIKLGDQDAILHNLYIHVKKQSDGLPLFRLHVRNLINGLPGDELLEKDILLKFPNESGWVKFNLKYDHIVLKGDIALTIEHLNVYKSEQDSVYRPYHSSMSLKNISALLTATKKKNNWFSRESIFDKWSVNSTISPNFYLKIQNR